MMAVNLYNFEINDFIKILYWLLKSNYMIPPLIIEKLDCLIIQRPNEIITKSWLCLLNVYSNSPEFKNIHSFRELKEKLKILPFPNFTDSVLAAVDLCKLELYDPSLWANLRLVNSAGDYGSIGNLRTVKLALHTEAAELQQTHIPELINNCIASALTMNAAQADLAIDQRFNIPFLSVSKLHREVKFTLKSIMSFEENFTYNETFGIDFYNQKENIGFDLHGSRHYFFPDLEERHDAITEDKLIGFMKLKQRLLQKNNVRVQPIPYYEWYRYTDHLEKILYLKKKLRLFRL